MKDESRSILATVGVEPDEPRSETLKAMRDVLAKRFGIDDPLLEADRELTSLGLDSLGFIEYAFDLESELHVVLPDIPRDLVTVGDFARFVEGELSRQAAIAAAQ